MSASTVRDGLAARDEEREINRDPAANRDDPMRSEPPSIDPLRYRAPELVELIGARASLPWVSLRVGDDRVEIARAQVGSLIPLMAPSGAGKSSLAMELAWRHALHTGPAIYVSIELAAHEVGARIVGQRCDASWEDAVRAHVASDEQAAALDVPRLIVLDGGSATIGGAVAAIERIGAECPDESILVVFDYLQLLDAPGPREERLRVAAIVEELRRLAQGLRVVVLPISQTSRASARQLADGELTGADTTATGAESSQVERAATITLALGNMRPQDDGTTAIDLSIGKGRMGQGDRVLPCIYDGRTGLWRVVGPAVSGAARRAERAAGKDAARVRAAAVPALACLTASTEPMSRTGVREAVGIKREHVYAAIDELIASGRVVEVRGRRPGGYWQVWTPERAAAAGLEIVRKGDGDA